MNNDDKNQNSYDTDEKNELFIGLIKKTKRKTVIRNVLISTLCSLVVVIILSYITQLLLANSVSNALHNIQRFKLISGPNVDMSEYRDNNSLFNGVAEYHTYKMIDDVPIPWRDNKIRYNLFDNFTRFEGGYSLLQVGEKISTTQGEYRRPYNEENGQRELMFYLPNVEYHHVINDFNVLNQIDNSKKIEMAISFDKLYTVEQIKNMLPQNISLNWFWVDTYSKKEIKGKQHSQEQMPEFSYNVYGLDAFADINREIPNNEQTFLDYIEEGSNKRGKYEDIYNQILNNIRGNKQQVVDSDVKIIGVVVTGEVNSMKNLQNQNYVRAAVLGAIAEKY